MDIEADRVTWNGRTIHPAPPMEQPQIIRCPNCFGSFRVVPGCVEPNGYRCPSCRWLCSATETQADMTARANASVAAVASGEQDPERFDGLS